MLKRPNGSVVAASDPDVSLVSLSNGALITIASPSSGSWTISIGGSPGAPFSLSVEGTSSLRLSSAEFVALAGRAGHAGYFPLTGEPVAGVASVLAATMTDGFANVSFVARSSTGVLLSSLNLAPEPGGSPLQFFGSVVPPNGPFIIYATGTDSHGQPFQRVLPLVVTPQRVLVSAPPPAILVRGATNQLSFTVHNLGAAATFNLLATDDRGFISAVSPESASLAADETRAITIDLAVPTTATPGTSETVTLVASSSVTSNHAVLTNVIQLVAGPSIVGVVPGTGPASGGTPITISSANVSNGATVLIGGTPATNVMWMNSTTITAVTPPNAAGTQDVTVINPDTQRATLSAGFAYVAALAPIPALSSAALGILAVALGIFGILTLRRTW
jgi:hypothetical protein